MAITSIKRDFSDEPNIVRIISTDNLATVGTVNYILNQADNIADINNGPFDWIVSDMVLVYASNGWGLFTISADFKSLTSFISGDAVVNLPVVVGDFAVFQSTTGSLEDLGYSPSNAGKQIVPMVDSVVAINHMAVYTDVVGTIGQDAATAINAGNIQAGLSTGTAGGLISYPASSGKGFLEVSATANTGNTNVTITNAAHGQGTAYTIADIGASSGTLVNSSTVNSLWTGIANDGGGTAGPVTITVAGMPAGIGTATISTSTNPVSILKSNFSVAGQVTVLFSGDPGASTVINLIVAY